MKSTTQDKYAPDGPELRTAGFNETELIVWTNFRSRRSLWPIPKLSLFCLNWVYSVWPIPKHQSFSSGPYPIFGLLGLANTQTSVCFFSSLPNLRSVQSGQYPNIGLFALAHIQSPVCFVWPIPSQRSVRSGPFPIVGLLRLVHTQASVCLVLSIPNPRSPFDKLETNSLMENCLNSSIESEKYTK